MFKAISDIMAHCHDIWNTIIVAINKYCNLCTAKKMNCALMFMIAIIMEKIS